MNFAKSLLAATAMISGSVPAVAQNSARPQISCNQAHKATLEVTLFNNLIGNEMDRAYHQQMRQHPKYDAAQLRRAVLKQISEIENVQFLRKEVRRLNRVLLNAPPAERCL